MRANLDDEGKLIPPSTVAAGRTRLSSLAYEISEILVQLEDPARRECSRRAYAKWRSKAQSSVAFFRREQEQLTAWVAERTCGAIDGVGAKPCFHDKNHDGLHSNGQRTWRSKRRAAAATEVV